MGKTSGRPAAEPGRPGRAASAADRLAGLLPGASLPHVRDVARSTFWLVPALCVTAAIGLGIGLIALDQALPVTHAVVVFPGPPEGARSFLSSIIQAMISFTGLVFSITIVVLQLSSGQFSPRVLRMFLSDRTIRFALGVFVATFVYAMVVLRAVRGTSAAGGFVPRIAVTVAFGFVLASVALFIRYISHVANMIRVATVITYVGAQARQIIGARYPVTAAEPESVPSLPPPARTITAPRGAVVVSVNEGRLVRAAAEAGCVLALVPRVGDFVPAGAPLVTIRPETELARGGPGEAGELILSGVALDTERSMEQDLAFGFRQLVDIAERALSPAVNDPTTAVQAIDVLHDLLRALATRTLPAGRWRDGDGQVRLVVPQYQFADFLDLAAGEIWHYGAGAAQVPGRLAAMLDDLHAAALPAYRPAIAAWSRRVAGVQRTGPGA
ncbi:MAG: DUF2254 domain-containing protein [Streptosporangiaceae bacterium]